MLYDLNVAWSPGTPATDLERTLRFANNLGYDVVALNHIITTAIPTQPSAITNPIPQLTPSTSTPTPTSTTTKPNAATTPSHLPTTLRRVTLTITDPSTTNYRLGDFTRAYDLVALRPTTEKAFAWACLSTTEPPALISLDMSSFLGWHMHPRTAMAAVHRGARFEVCYAQALSLSSSPDPDAQRRRANFIGNVQSLLRATRGRGIVVASEARDVLALRAPADVVNLMAVWGLGPERGMEAIGAGARSVVVNEGIRRRGFRGVVDIVRPAGEEEGAAAARREEVEKGKAAAAVTVAGGKKGKGGQGQGQGQKRKNVDGSGGNAGAQGTVSKRQAKKLRKEVVQTPEAA